MNRQSLGTTWYVFGLLASSAILATTAHAVRQGDCDDSGMVQINEVQRCANIFTGAQALDLCPPCDFDGSTEVEINEIQGAANCFLDADSTGCRMVLVPTQTPEATNTTPPPPTATPLATETPVSTDTPTPEPTHTATPPPTDTPEPTFTATQVEPTATPTQGMAVCGNDEVEPGETCDDGNTMDGDSCPSDCVILACVPDGTMRLTNVNYQSQVSLISITVIVEYPDGVLQIPGTGTDASVGQRVINRSPGLASFVDFNYALRGSISGASAFPTTRAFSINFDNCQSASPPVAGDFTCTVLEAVDTNFENVAGVTCSVALP